MEYIKRAERGLAHLLPALTNPLTGEARMADFTPMDIAAFWSRVEGSTPFQCWPWQGQKNDKGYGRWRGSMAHRAAYELVHGPIPEGQIVRHRCDNPPCCNPDHLVAGTHVDNAQDALTRGRFSEGARHGNTKLTQEQADYIRRNPDGKRQRDLAKQFGVSVSTISYIRSGRSWRMVGARGFEPLTSCVSSKRSTPELSSPGSPQPLASSNSSDRSAA
jgi:hypothetical protein